jgi:Protein of unknown function (DUF1036)
MKNLLFLAFSFIVTIGVFGQNKIEMYNNTDKDIYASYAYFDYSNSCWSSKGWFKIAPYSARTLDLGTYANDLYIHGYTVIPSTFWESVRTINWGNDVQFCIDLSNAFEIRYADKVNCEKKKSFSKLRITPGLNKWTFSN